MKLKFKEETMYRAVTSNYVVNVYQRTISRKWAYYIVSKKTKCRIRLQHDEFDGPDEACERAGEVIDEIKSRGE
jgi:hypothetical protein